MDASDEKDIIDAVHRKIVNGHSYYQFTSMCTGIEKFSLHWEQEHVDVGIVASVASREMIAVSQQHRALDVSFYPVGGWEKLTGHFNEIIYVDMGHTVFRKRSSDNMWENEQFTARVRNFALNVNANGPLVCNIELVEVPDPLQVVSSMNCP